MKTVKPRENKVEKAVVKWMTARGWRAKRNNNGRMVARSGQVITLGDPGFPDWTFWRPLRPFTKWSCIQICHIEVKRPGAQPTKLQCEKIAARNAEGQFGTWVDSVEILEGWYHGIGLQRFDLVEQLTK